MPDEIRPNAVRNVSVQLTIVASSSVYSESNVLSSPPISFWAQPCALATPVSGPNHSSQSHAQTTPASCPNYSCLMLKLLLSHAQTTPASCQTTPVSCPNYSCLMLKLLLSHSRTTPVSFPNHSCLMPVSIDVIIIVGTYVRL